MKICSVFWELLNSCTMLGARYCLAGTVEVGGTRLTVTAELLDKRGANVFWAERYTGFVDDVHVMRGEIRSRILASLELQIPLHEANEARLTGTENLDAWSAYHLGLQHLYRFNSTDKANEWAENVRMRRPGISQVNFFHAFPIRHPQVRACVEQALERLNF